MNPTILLLAAVAPWQTPEVNSINRLPARCLAVPCETEEMAVDIAKWLRPKSDSRWVISLDGEWDFRWKRSPDRDWEKTSKIKVPSCWQLQGEYDPPLYINSLYPLAFNQSGDPMGEPPAGFTSREFRNPVGLYKTTFKRPWRWWFRRTVLRFEGVSSAFYVRVNGEDVGYAEDSRLPSEFDLTPHLKWFGENTLEVEVFKHSDGTFLEDQDFWRLSGIFRSVSLVSEHKKAPRDFVAETSLSSDFKTGVVRISNEKGELLKERRIDNPYLWSSELPCVYMTPVEHKWGWWIFGGTDHYIISFGFRKVEIKNSVVLINGRRAVFRGVNRHEMDPESGYTVGRDLMERDVEIMRFLNVNAVRTSHYPNAPDWYDLCDRAGLMLVCEANVESHGAPNSDTPANSVANDPKWRRSHVDRGVRMVGFYRNHPSVIFWSLGNESGNGPNLEAEYETIKAMDKTRPVQYCGARDSWNTDIKCPAYTRPWDCEAYASTNPPKPMILCEYSHAMGNSNGGICKYWDLVRKYPPFQGGFIWDFADQALWKTDSRGRWLAYGGDFADVPNDGNFNCNGVVDALRNPHPAANEIKYAYRPVQVDSFDWNARVAKIHNSYMFTDLEELDEITWTGVDGDGNETSKGSIRDFSLGPGRDGEIKLDGFSGESVTLRFMRDGRLVAWDSFTRPFSPPAAPAVKSAADPKAFRINLWRAPIDNDRGWKMPEVCRVWKEATDSQKMPEGVKSDLKVSKTPDGSTFVDWTLTVPAGLPPIPRAGLSFTLPADAGGKVEYVGLGPWENYSDRSRSAYFGRHTATVGAVSGVAAAATGRIVYPRNRLNPDNYVEPGEQGYRTGCRRLFVAGREISAVSAPFGFNVWPYTQEALEAADHQWNVKASDGVWTVNIDAVQMGVGGDDSWGARPHDDVMPGAGTYRLSFLVKGL
ncbi:MAG: hypothetical protein J6T01_01050 [Kiritimatiellae bacterium]|nr:hypothetical protein [Kiritimatiellia bacterium]